MGSGEACLEAEVLPLDAGDRGCARRKVALVNWRSSLEENELKSWKVKPRARLRDDLAQKSPRFSKPWRHQFREFRRRIIIVAGPLSGLLFNA